MTPERWQKVKSIFDRALESSPASRLAFIRERCGADEELRREVESLLAADSDTGSLLDNPLMETGLMEMGKGASHPSAPSLAQDDSFGAYVPVRVLGEGGMGTVYLARQLQPIRRDVALKVVKLGMDSRQVLERFEIERQALALMDYPNVARVLDAGTSERGRPYFVMEYVDGVPITQYCDANSLSTRQRLQLFIPVCNALQHAHKKGIIHRDVKPSNILVTEVDGKPSPKVIDFGIARAIEQRSVELNAFTLDGQIIGTPEYMSPEQANLDNRDIDTGTDVYSLGVVLYELLVGALPLDLKSMRKLALGEVLRAIRETPVPKPTARITQMGASAEGLALHRSTNPGQLKRDLAGDIDSIVMKAIDKDRHCRYASASEFAADIERYLKSEPVLAGPPGAAYRMRKFAVRHKLPVTAAAAVALALIAGILATTWEARVAGQQRTRAEQQATEAATQRDAAQAARDRATTAERAATNERDRAVAAEGRAQQERNVALAEKRRADSASATATAVNDFLQKDLLAQADVSAQSESGVSTNSDLKVRTALDRARRVLGEEHQSAAQVMGDLGMTYFNQGKYAQAEPHLTNALKLNRRVLGEEHSDTLKFMYTLGALYFDQANCRCAGADSKAAQAEPLLAKALELYRRVLGSKDPSTTSAKLTLARLWLYQRKYVDSEPLLREALNDYEKLQDGWMLYRTQYFLGESLAGQQKFSEAEPLLLSGYQEMIQQERTGPLKINASGTAGDQIVQLYQDWGKPEKVAEWRAKLKARNPFIKDGNVIQDPGAPVSLRLAPGWTLQQSSRLADSWTMLWFGKADEKITADIQYQYPLPAPYPADPDVALREEMDAKVRLRQERDGKKDYHVRPGSVQNRLVGGHPALSFIGEYTLQGRPFVDYTVRVLGKSTQAQFFVAIPAKAEVDDFCKRFDLIVNTLQIP